MTNDLIEGRERRVSQGETVGLDEYAPYVRRHEGLSFAAVPERVGGAELFVDWCGARLAWWPQGVPQLKRCGLISSRLGRQLARRTSWFAALRSLCRQLRPDRELLVASVATAGAPFVSRAAALWGLDLLRIDSPPRDGPPHGVDRWLRRILKAGPHAETALFLPRLWTVTLSPLLDALPEQIDGFQPWHAALCRDRALVVLSERLYVIHARRRGTTDQLVRARLADPRFGAQNTFVADDPGLVPRDLFDDYLNQGAAGWKIALPHIEQRPIRAQHDRRPVAGKATSRPLRRCRFRMSSVEYLTHTTRAALGPWPDQSAEQYLDELILGLATSERSPLTSLVRMVAQGRIVASAQSVRGNVPVVCFTAVPLRGLESLRVFRPHRGRWDFEPYGLCIERSWLIERGARPAIYGDDALWERLDAKDRPFFQLARTRKRFAGRAIDWRREQEWRIAGDVDLSKLPSHRALLFVPTAPEAKALARRSRWPVAVVKSSEGEAIDVFCSKHDG